MSDWTGSGSAISVAAAVSCLEYLTVEDVRAEFGEDVSSLSDAQIQRKIDRLTAIAEGLLGHTFGRGVVARSTAADTVAVSAAELTIGGTSYTFAAYPLLFQLVAAVNGAGGTYRLEILPQVNPNTPSALLSVRGAAVCGPSFENRIVLCLQALWVQVNGKGTSHVFLPLPLASVNSVYENTIAVSSVWWWATSGSTWIIKRACGCTGTSLCHHPRGKWSPSYPGNIEVTYVPLWWGTVPSAIVAALLDAFEAQAGLGAIQSESFGEYSYSRALRSTATAPIEQVLSGALRPFQVQFQP